MIETVKIEQIDELIERLNRLGNHFVYRGQADASWTLTSSLERVIDANWSERNAIEAEKRTLEIFKSKFHLYDRVNMVPNSKLAWLSLMQHYGVPTRLVDFTESPYAALYFSLEFYMRSTEKNFAVFAIDYTALMEKSLRKLEEIRPEFSESRKSFHLKREEIFDEIVDPSKYDLVWVTEPTVLNDRLDRQSGSFVFSGNRGARLQELLESPLYDDVAMYKYEMSSALYEGVYALLRKMNITSKTLYGDLEGLARSLRMELQVYLG